MSTPSVLLLLVPVSSLLPPAASELSDALLVQARARLEERHPLDALPLLDQLLDASPRASGIWRLRGDAALAAASQGHQPAFLYADALQSYERSLELEPTALASFGACRAALATGDFDRALEGAETGIELLAGGGARLDLPVPPERLLAEATYRVYVARKRAEHASAPELFTATEAALRELLRRDERDAWAWTSLAELHQWESAGERAIEILAAALERLPDEADVHQRYADAVRASGGRPAVIARYAAFNTAHPDNALGLWYEAGETAYLGVDELLASRGSAAYFERAEELFARCREVESAYERACTDYELLCRNGLGWARLREGKAEAAERAFRSMEELERGGLERELEGSLLSGVQGLEFVADTYARRGTVGGLIEAGRVFEVLRRHAPADPDYANNSGFFHREAAIAAEALAQGLARESTTTGDPAERAERRSGSERHRALARELIRTGYAAYLAASELAPTDVRVLNDTALVMTYYVRTDAREAERMLRRAVAAAEEQLPALEARLARARGDDEQRALTEELDRLLEAYGDAFENLGVLHLTLTGEPGTARECLERCVEIGPLPRVDRRWASEVLLPLCDALEAGHREALQRLAGRVWLHAGRGSS